MSDSGLCGVTPPQEDFFCVRPSNHLGKHEFHRRDGEVQAILPPTCANCTKGILPSTPPVGIWPDGCPRALYYHPDCAVLVGRGLIEGAVKNGAVEKQGTP